jgi:hypothetical protein
MEKCRWGDGTARNGSRRNRESFQNQLSVATNVGSFYDNAYGKRRGIIFSNSVVVVKKQHRPLFAEEVF